MSYRFEWDVVFNADMVTIVTIGLRYTLIVSFLSLIFGNCVGLIAAVLRISGKPPLPQLAYIYIDFFRTTPALVQLIWIFYVLPIIAGIDLSPIAAGVIALSLNAGAFLAEVFRAGIESIGKGQRDATFVLGLSRFQSFVHVLLPQALRRVLPATGNVLISLIKDSALLTTIAVPELTYQFQTDVARTFRPLELYTALAVMYFLLTYPLSLAASALERRYRVT
ncbi:MAG TPA: amino acid ABC transporter permease [Bradyrhizobium sp.]|nr:amino acid ABC transporter permease [Bradyrhizobium sp.]